MKSTSRGIQGGQESSKCRFDSKNISLYSPKIDQRVNEANRNLKGRVYALSSEWRKAISNHWCDWRQVSLVLSRYQYLPCLQILCTSIWQPQCRRFILDDITFNTFNCLFEVFHFFRGLWSFCCQILLALAHKPKFFEFKFNILFEYVLYYNASLPNCLKWMSEPIIGVSYGGVNEFHPWGSATCVPMILQHWHCPPPF